MYKLSSKDISEGRLFLLVKMSYQERKYRPNLTRKLPSTVLRPGRNAQKSAAINLHLAENGLLDNHGVISVKDCLTPPLTQTDTIDPAKEITDEVGISLDVLEVFAEEQRRAPGSIHALLDDEYPKPNGQAPKSIVEEDYSADSRP